MLDEQTPIDEGEPGRGKRSVARTVAFGILALAAAALCARLGFWQIHRLHDRRAFNATVRSGFAAAPVPLDDLLPRGAAADDDLTFRRVSATGTYVNEGETLLYGRSHIESAGSDVLTPLLLDDGRAVVVDRGWVPADAPGPPVPAASPPDGPVTVQGILIPFDQDSGGSDATATIAKVDEGVLGRRSGLPLVPMYLQLQSQTPAQSGTFPIAAPLPELSEGPHLSYAIQWFSFATIALVGYAALVRRDISDSWRDRRRDHAG